MLLILPVETAGFAVGSAGILPAKEQGEIKIITNYELGITNS